MDETDLQNAGEHIRAQMNGLGKELYRTIVVLCCQPSSSVFLQVCCTSGGQMRPHRSQPIPPAASTQSAPTSSPDTTQPNHKKRPQSNVQPQQCYFWVWLL